LTLQLIAGADQVQRFAGFAGEALSLVQQALADAARTGDLTHAQVRQAPAVVALFQQCGAEQAVVEALGDQAFAAAAGLEQWRCSCIGREPPVRGVGAVNGSGLLPR
jgi:hypothetical protein